MKKKVKSLASHHRAATDIASAFRDEVRALSTDLKATVATAVKREIRAAMVQLEAQASLLARINGKRPLPPMHGWPISPDFGLVVTDLLDSRDTMQ